MMSLERRLGALFAPTTIGDQIMRAERGRDGAAMVKAHKLAATCGARIEKEAPRAYWVFAPAGCDAIDGNNFCTSGREVLEAVQACIDWPGEKAK